MGVMTCHRHECENIMCDTYVDGVGYVCRECKEEFKDFMGKDFPATEGSMKMQLKTFMDTPKGLFKKGKTIDVDEFFQKYTQ